MDKRVQTKGSRQGVQVLLAVIYRFQYKEQITILYFYAHNDLVLCKQ